MANENQSRDSMSRQQSAERSQTGASQQGTGGQHTSYGQGNYGQGAQQGQGSQGSSGQGHGQSGQGSPSQGSGRYGGQGAMSRQGTGTSTWAGGRQGREMQPRGMSSLSPYYGGSGFGSGPFSIMRRISDEMDRLFENFGMGGSLFPSQGRQGEGQGAWDVGGYNEGMQSMWSPHVEVCERNGKLLIEADLPGMKRDDIHVRVEDDEVIIQGERRNETSGSQGGYYRSERRYGSFYRTIPLPEGTNADSANATFKDGVLEIEFDAPRQSSRGRTLQIGDGGSSSQQSRGGTGSGQTYGSGHTGSMEGASSGGTGTSASGGTMHTGANPSSGPMHGGSTSGTGSATGGQHTQSGTSGSYGAGMSGSTGAQHSASGGATGGQQQSQSGSGGSAGGGVERSSGSGTMYSGSGNPSVGAAGMGASHTGGSSDKSSDKSSKS
jgi:HSP20 family protein